MFISVECGGIWLFCLIFNVQQSIRQCIKVTAAHWGSYSFTRTNTKLNRTQEENKDPVFHCDVNVEHTRN